MGFGELGGAVVRKGGATPPPPDFTSGELDSVVVCSLGSAVPSPEEGVPSCHLSVPCPTHRCFGHPTPRFLRPVAGGERQREERGKNEK
uniref:Uncharacterized protein n=1 Tax=Oryza punctata TaxID=4537 RepID=A0A0E0LAA6_ORYPU